jgi:poly-gamma-glutamate synthesis protein (capsule biosynthesis protein)
MNTTITLCLAGDVMLGRGVDQMLPHPCDPELFERYVGDAREYLALAEREGGPLPDTVEPGYVWGDGLEILVEEAPDVRVVNLETAVTRSVERWPSKGIHYRMSPENAAALEAAGIDVCSLANNHVLDWGYPGLEETLRTLDGRGLLRAGAGEDLEEAKRPAVVELGGKGRVLVFGLCGSDAGVYVRWGAAEERPGLWLVEDFSEATAEAVGEVVDRWKRPSDLAVASVHWGGNWGWEVPESHVCFGRALVEWAGIDVVHGHSSHHVKACEIHDGRPILYGCGDLITDYEGIGGHEQFRGELGAMYFPRMDVASGELEELVVRPTLLKRMRLNRPSDEEVEWVAEVLRRTGDRFGTRVEMEGEGRILPVS